MKHKFILCMSMLIVIATMILPGCKSENTIMNSESTSNITQASIDSFYDNYVRILLQQELYNSKDAYDSCHYLMIPMYYAFQTNNETYIKMFANYMSKFVTDVSDGNDEFDSLSWLNRNHHLYWAAEYMCLCVEYGYDVSEDLYGYVYNMMNEYVEEYTGNWQTENVSYYNMWDLFDENPKGCIV